MLFGIPLGLDDARIRKTVEIDHESPQFKTSEIQGAAPVPTYIMEFMRKKQEGG